VVLRDQVLERESSGSGEKLRILVPIITALDLLWGTGSLASSDAILVLPKRACFSTRWSEFGTMVESCPFAPPPFVV
jgi:hypothetical protein